MNPGNVIVLLSGGMDSTACLHFYKKEDYNVTPLYINFGQIAAPNELTAARNVCQHYNLELRTLNCIGDKQFSNGNISGRNAFLLITALMHFDFKYAIIALGIHTGTDYQDCTPEFLNRMQTVYDLYKNGTIKIGAPFIKWTKNEIYDYCLLNNIPLKLTYSCELGLKQPCGICKSCKDLMVFNDI